jgi:spore germination protein GerM
VKARSVGLAVLLLGVTAALIWLLFIGLPRWYVPRDEERAAAPSSVASAPTGRTIKANLFYVAEDGTTLSSVERDVPYAENTAEQAKAIIEAQIAPVTDPLVSAVPPGTRLRALFVTKAGEAYVDLSPDVVSAHPGGSTNEMLTIYTLVDALTANLPAVTAVQLLVDGKEIETLAGHVDIRRPFTRRVP